MILHDQLIIVVSKINLLLALISTGSIPMELFYLQVILLNIVGLVLIPLNVVATKIIENTGRKANSHKSLHRGQSPDLKIHNVATALGPIYIKKFK